MTQKGTGGRQGWRLPTIEELSSLGDEASNLPPGHPFVNVRMGTPFSRPAYWSATKYPNTGSLSLAFVLGFPSLGGSNTTDNLNFYWCVRGPGGANFAFLSPTGASSWNGESLWRRLFECGRRNTTASHLRRASIVEAD